MNTLWCLIGCSIGDFGTIYYFQVYPNEFSTMTIMILAWEKAKSFDNSRINFILEKPWRNGFKIKNNIRNKTSNNKSFIQCCEIKQNVMGVILQEKESF